jgi:uncharacterized protein involved in exopolysaccharide biosynthesis
LEALHKIEPEVSIPPAAAGPQHEPELIDYLLVLWRWKLLIALGTIVAAAAALAVSFVTPKVYEASATLMVLRSKFGSEQLLGPQQLALTAKTYEGIIKNSGPLSEAIAKFQLGEPPNDLKVRDLERAVQINAVKDTALLTLSVEMGEPRLAAGIANFLAQRAIDLNSRLNEGEVGDSRTFLETQVDHTAASLKEAQAALESFQKEANIEIVRKQQEVCLTRMADLQMQRTNVEADLAAVNGNLASLEKDLRQQPQTLKTSRTLVEDPAYQQAMAKASRADIAGLLGINMQTEELNPTYSFLQQALAEARRDAAGLAARKHELDRLLAENDQTLAKVQNELTEKTTRLETLTRTYELERDSYKTLRSRSLAANVEVVSKTSLLKVVDPALPPQRHVRPRKSLNTALGGAAGFFGMVMLAFFFDYVQRAQHAPRRDAS